MILFIKYTKSEQQQFYKSKIAKKEWYSWLEIGPVMHNNKVSKPTLWSERREFLPTTEKVDDHLRKILSELLLWRSALMFPLDDKKAQIDRSFSFSLYGETSREITSCCVRRLEKLFLIFELVSNFTSS